MELGSEFNLQLESLKIKKNNIFHYLNKYYHFYFDSGRSALTYLYNLLGASTQHIWLPEYICESVVNCFPANNIRFYELDDQFQIVLTDELQIDLQSNTSIFYLMHYFGHLQSRDILIKLERLHNSSKFHIIEDTTHSLLTNPLTIGDYGIASLRKWFPIEDGGVLYSKKSFLYPDLIKKQPGLKSYAMILKTLFLNNELECNELYRNYFIQSEHGLDECSDIYRISDLSEFILRCQDISEVKTARMMNYATLKKNLSPYLYVLQEETPFVFLLRVKKRDQLRSWLMDNKIYCAVHWPEFSNMTSHAVKISQELLSLPVDQRYSKFEMQYLIDAIKSYKE